MSRNDPAIHRSDVHYARLPPQRRPPHVPISGSRPTNEVYLTEAYPLRCAFDAYCAHRSYHGGCGSRLLRGVETEGEGHVFS